MRNPCTIALAGSLLLCVTIAHAQINPSTLLSATSQNASNTNYYFARANDITIIVNVMGFVERPGRYEIASSIDLMNLISLAGGPVADGTLSNVEVIRIVKEGEKSTRKEIKVDLDNLAKLKPEELQLTPGDVILVDRTTWSVVRDVLTVGVSAVLITASITQIISSTKK